MYTEFHFRAKIVDGPVSEWLDENINAGKWFDESYDASEKFFQNPRWVSVFLGGGAVYQYSTDPVFRVAKASYEDSWLALHSSMKNYSDQIDEFIEWITPSLKMFDGEFLGYSLYEDSGECEDDWRERPILYFHGRKPVYS